MGAIEVENIQKYYGKHLGVRDVSFTVEAGEIFGFVGPNGAGKSTTLKILLGFIFADAGSAAIYDLNVEKKSKAIKRFTGYVPSDVRLYSNMRVKELLRRNNSFYKLDTRAEAQRLCEVFEVDPKKRFRELSGGNKKKVSLVCALAPRPRVLILDEPTGGLDPVMQKRLFGELKTLAGEGVAILLSSHNLAEVQEYCNQVAFIKDGVVAAVADLRGQRQSKIVTAVGGVQEVPTGLTLLRQQDNKRVFRTELASRDLLMALAHLVPEDFTVEEESLEDGFMRLYEGGVQP